MQTLDISKIVPLRDGVLIKPFEQDGETSSGMLLPEQQHQATPVLGEVIAKGGNSQFEVGDIVFFRRYSIDELSFPVDGKKITVSFLTDSEIVAKFKKDE